MEYTIGTAVFNDWIITKEIGQGAAGKVYEIKKSAYEEEDIRSALKVISIPKSSSDIKAVMSEGMTEKDVTCYYKEFVDEILREIKIMVSLKAHPNIVTYEDHCIIPHQESIGWDILIKMELLVPLLEWQLDHPLKEEEIIRLGCEISSALAYASEHGLVHRDVKPGNIFVDAFGQFKLGDFGIARTIEKTMGVMSKKGTESYMAPEVYLGKKYNAQVDIYSLGIVLYRFLNNSRLPFYPPYPDRISYSDRENALEKRIQGLPFPEPVNGSPQLKKIVLKACEYLPENRYATMKEMHQALLMLHDDQTIQIQNTESKTVPQKRNSRKVAVAILSAIVISGVILAVADRKAAQQKPVAEKHMESKTVMPKEATEPESVVTGAVIETTRETVATDGRDLSQYLGYTTDEAKQNFGEPRDEYWSMGVTRLIYDDYIFDSAYTVDGADMISEIWLKNSQNGSNLYGIQTQMSEEEAAEVLLKHGFSKLEAGAFYNGADQFVAIREQTTDNSDSDGNTEASLLISASQMRESLHPDKTEVFQYMKCTIEQVLQKMDGLNVYASDGDQVIAENDGVRFTATRDNSSDLEKAVVNCIILKGEGTQYCLYGITPEDREMAGEYLSFSEGGSGELIDPSGSVLYLWDSFEGENAISLTSRY